MRKYEPGRGEIKMEVGNSCRAHQRDILTDATLTSQSTGLMLNRRWGHFDTPPLHCEATALAVKPKQNALTTPLFSLVPFLFFLSLFLLPSSGEILVKVPFHH